MKKLLVLFLLISNVALCQDTTLSVSKSDTGSVLFTITGLSSGRFLTADTIGYFSSDTIQCLLLVCDTLKQKHRDHFRMKLWPNGFLGVGNVPAGYIPWVAWLKGYRVVQHMGWRSKVIYLDYEKKPLSHSYFVWQSADFYR
jgi:hypothetical protein